MSLPAIAGVFGDTQTAAGTAGAPTAGSAICQIVAPPAQGAGTYKATVWVVLTATAETAAVNLQLRYNSTITRAFPTFGLGALTPIVFDRVTLDGINPLRVEAVANAAVGSVYTAVVSIVRVN